MRRREEREKEKKVKNERTRTGGQHELMLSGSVKTQKTKRLF